MWAPLASVVPAESRDLAAGGLVMLSEAGGGVETSLGQTFVDGGVARPGEEKFPRAKPLICAHSALIHSWSRTVHQPCRTARNRSFPRHFRSKPPMTAHAIALMGSRPSRGRRRRRSAVGDSVRALPRSRKGRVSQGAWFRPRSDPLALWEREGASARGEGGLGRGLGPLSLEGRGLGRG